MNIRLIAVEVGDALKYSTTLNEIDRIGGAIFPFQRDDFPNDAITSSRAKRIHDWVMSLGRHNCTADERTPFSRLFSSALPLPMRSGLVFSAFWEMQAFRTFPLTGRFFAASTVVHSMQRLSRIAAHSLDRATSFTPSSRQRRSITSPCAKRPRAPKTVQTL